MLASLARMLAPACISSSPGSYCSCAMLHSELSKLGSSRACRHAGFQRHVLVHATACTPQPSARVCYSLILALQQPLHRHTEQAMPCSSSSSS